MTSGTSWDGHTGHDDVHIRLQGEPQILGDTAARVCLVGVLISHHLYAYMITLILCKGEDISPDIALKHTCM